MALAAKAGLKKNRQTTGFSVFVVAGSGFVRVIDDSDEDYLYPESYFAPLDLPSEVKKALLA